MQVLATTSAAAIYPAGETRPRPLTAEQVKALGRDAAQAWLRRLITTAPIEVSVVGRHRPRGGDAAGDALSRRAARAAAHRRQDAGRPAHDRPARGAASASRSRSTRARRRPRSFAGFFGTDLANVRDTRLLNVAARVLSTRMMKTDPRGQAARLQHRRLVGARRHLPRLRPVRRGGADGPGQGAGAGRGGRGDVRGAGQGRPDSGRAGRGQAADGEPARRDPEGPRASGRAVSPRSTIAGRRSTTCWARAPPTRRSPPTDVRDGFARYDRPEARLRFVITPK